MAKRKIRMLTSIAEDRWSARPKQVIERDADEAQRLIDAGLAEAVADDVPLTFPAEVETAARAQPETATSPRGKRK